MTDIQKKTNDLIIELTPAVCESINKFSENSFKTRGGRMGSGMGMLLEALWGYFINQELDKVADKEEKAEIAWLQDNEFNDFACVLRNKQWNPQEREGELFRIEAKSMNLSADESKAHFDELSKNLNHHDLLLVLVWRWEEIDGQRVYPRIIDNYVGRVSDIATLRDALHLARGGSFVDRGSCPDGCVPANCSHDSEPLNASGKRERLSGPETCRPSANVSFAANFGGLVRMLKTNSIAARTIFRKIRKENNVANDYISFMHRNFPSEERNQYLVAEWKLVANKLGIDISDGDMSSIMDQIRAHDDYQDVIRNFE